MPDRIPAYQENVRRRVLWPLGITLVVFLALFLGSFQLYLQRELGRQLTGRVADVLNLYQKVLDERAADMLSFIEVISEDKALLAAMRNRDRQRLQDLAAPLYRKLQRHQAFTHFYFHDQTGHNILRVHKPERYGDLIERLTMKQAQSSLQASVGPELGPLGTFTLRAVVPWFVGDEKLGFIEFGEEVEPLVEQVAEQGGAELIVLIDKQLLEHAGWIEGQQMLGRSSSWEFLPNHVVTAVTDQALLNGLAQIVTAENLQGVQTIEIPLLNRQFQGRFVPLTDVSGRRIGDILLLQDVSETIQAHRLAIYLVTFFCILLGGVLFASAYTILGRTEHALEQTRAKLVDEIDKTLEANTQLGLEIGVRRAAEKALQQAQFELEQRVVERTYELDQQKRLVERMVTTIPSSVAWKNLAGVYLGCNARYAQLAGSSELEIVGRQDADLPWNPAFAVALADIDNEVLKGGQAVMNREICDESNGKIAFYLCSAVLLQDEEGAPAGLVSILQNITEQKEREQLLEQTLTAIRQSNDRISGVVQSVDDALFVVDAEDRLLLLNESAALMLRAQPDEVVGQPVIEAIWQTPLRDKIMEVLRKRQGNVLFEFELGGAGQAAPLVMQARSSLLADSRGRYEGMVFLARDVTRDRSMDRLKSDFISMAAHELRTPLATILGFSELLLDEELSEEVDRKEFAQTIHGKAEALTRLLDDMLDISRIESGRGLELDIRKVMVVDLVMPIAGQYEKARHDRKIVVDLEDPELLLLADTDKFGQVLENLLSNAVKYSEVESTITVSGTTGPDGYHLTIADQGRGMTPEQVKHAFDKFYRGDTADRAIRGTGIGLTIVKHIVREHDGQVWIESRPGKGTLVHLLMPIA